MHKRVAASTRPIPGEVHCGDRAQWWERNGHWRLCIVDGLGHGQYAEVAAKAAVRYVSQHLEKRLDKLFAGCDAALRNTRGAAMGIVDLDPVGATATYAGVGNTRAYLHGAANHRFSSDYGIVGAGYRRLVVESVPVRAGDVIVMATDGLAEAIDLSGYSAEALADPEALAERVLEDWSNGNDDRGVLVFRMED